MRPIFVRLARSDDQEKVVNWVTNVATSINADSLTYKNTKVLVAYQEQEVLLYAPVQNCLFLDSVIPNPDVVADEKDGQFRLSHAVLQVLSALKIKAEQAGIGECYFIATTEGLEFTAERFALEELPFKVYKLKV